MQDESKKRVLAPETQKASAMTTTAVLVDDTSISAELSGVTINDVMESRTIDGYVTVDLVALDPRTGAPTTLKGVRVEMSDPSIMNGLRKGQRFTLHIASYEEFVKRNVRAMTAVPAPETPTVQNQSIPTPVKIPDPMGGFGGKPMAQCKAYAKTEQEAKSYMGFIADRNDITVIQGKDNGRSPGVLIQQADGKLYLFDNSGQQHIVMGDSAIKVQTPLFKLGAADIGRNTPLFPVPMMENKVLDIVPNGTLLTPQPKLIINFLEAVNLITSVMDLVRLGSLCYSATKIILGYKQGSLEQTVQKARYSSTEVAYYGGTKNVPEAPYQPPDIGEEEFVPTVEEVEEEG